MDAGSVLADAGVVLAIVGATALLAGLIYLRMDHGAHYGLGPYGETDPNAMTNCPDCGARNDTDQAVCEYCSEPLGGDGDTPGQNTEDDRWGTDEWG